MGVGVEDNFIVEELIQQGRDGRVWAEADTAGVGGRGT